MTVIGDLLVEFRERAAAKIDPEVLTLTERNGFVRQAERFNKRLATEDTSKYKVVRRDDIAFNPYLLWAGAVAQNTIVDEGIISPLYPTFRVKPGFDTRYVARLLLTPQMIAAYDGIAFGSVPRRRRSSVKDFLELAVPAPPPIDEQRRLASILDHADALEGRAKALLMRAREVEGAMLGRWDSSSEPLTLRQLGWEFSTGKNVVAGAAAAHPVNRVIKVSAISKGKFVQSESKPLPLNYDPPTKHRIAKGDILFGRASGSLDLLGVTAVVNQDPGDLYLPDKVWRLELRGAQTTTRYSLALLRSRPFLEYVRHNASGAAGVRNIGKKAVLDFAVRPLSPQDQRRFEEVVTTIDATQAQAHRMLKVVASLTGALQAQAFSGRL